MKINWKKTILATLAVWIVGTLYTFLTCAWLFNWVYEIEPIIWIAPEAMMTTSNMIGSNIIGIVSALFFVLVFVWLMKGLPSKGWKKGLYYGLFLWLAATFAGIASMPFYMTISWTVIIYWLISLFVRVLIMGAIVAAIYKK
ncbi:MAG: hypothetical protein ABIF40_02925 [archaeon]